MPEIIVPKVHRLLPGIAALSAIPLLLTSLHFFLPPSVVDQFIFHFHDPSIVAAWTSGFLHVDVAHLRSNILGYVLAIAPTYFLYVSWDRRRAFWTTVGTLFLVTPFATTGIDYMLLHLYWELTGSGAVSRGFSGIASAFGGCCSLRSECFSQTSTTE